MRRAAFVPVVCAACLGCAPRVPPPPEMLPLDTDALALEGVEQAQETAERLVALAGVVGAFIGSQDEIYDALRDGGFARLADRAALASASCNADIVLDYAGAVHAVWREPCTLSTGSVVTGDLTVVESSDGNAVTILLAATGDGFTLIGFVGLSPQFWPVAWLLDDYNGFPGFASIALFDADTRVAPDDAGVFVVELPSVTSVTVPATSAIGTIGGRVCALGSRATVVEGLVRRAGECAISAGSLSVTSQLACARVEGETDRVTGSVELAMSPAVTGSQDVTLFENVDGRQATHPVSLESRPLGCR